MMNEKMKSALHDENDYLSPMMVEFQGQIQSAKHEISELAITFENTATKIEDMQDLFDECGFDSMDISTEFQGLMDLSDGFQEQMANINRKLRELQIEIKREQMAEFNSIQDRRNREENQILGSLIGFPSDAINQIAIPWIPHSF